jgi:hypothetical protein
MRYIGNVPEIKAGLGRSPTSGVWDARAVSGSAWAKGASFSSGLYIFSPSASAQSFVVPAGKSRMFARVWGAGGRSSTHTGGNGGYAEGLVAVTPGETLYAVVGRTGIVHGATSTVMSAWGCFYNGGEISGIFENATPDFSSAPNRATAHDNAIIIAGGAGAPWNEAGAYGGGTTGGSNPAQESSARGGTQSAGGSSGASGTPLAGNKLIGGYNGTGQRGGGSGYYGGGGTYYTTGTGWGGGGGSGYIGHSRITDGLFKTGNDVDGDAFWIAGVGVPTASEGTMNGCGLIICEFL